MLQFIEGKGSGVLGGLKKPERIVVLVLSGKSLVFYKEEMA